MKFNNDNIISVVQQMAKNRYTMMSWVDRQIIAKEIVTIKKLEETDLNEIKWLWEKTISTLIEHWIKNKSDLKEKGITFIKKLKLNPISFNSIKKYLSE